MILQNEPAEMLKTDHDFKPTEDKNVPPRCDICKKKVQVVDMVTVHIVIIL